MKTICLPLLFLTLFSTQLISQNNALDFDGTNDYLEVSYNSAINPASFTIEAWFKVDALGTDQSIMTSRMSAGSFTGGYMIYVLANNSLAFWTGNGTSSYDQLNSGYTVTTEWTHVACTFTRIGTVSTKQIYINGVLHVTGTYDGGSTYTPSTVNPLRIGAGGDGTAAYFFNGKIDEVCVWSDVRSQAEIRSNMYQELTGAESDLIAYYKFNETSGTTANDSQTSSYYDGTLTNMTGTELITSSAFFGPKNCLDFDGTDDIVNATLLDFTANDRITISAWIKPSSVNSLQNVIEIGDQNGHAIWLNANGGFYGSTIFASSGWVKVESNNFVLTAGQWHHVVYTYNGTNQYIYLDGASVGSNSIVEQFANSPTGNTSISDDNGYFEGAIDEVHIWDDVRTDTEIREYMCKTLVGNESNLVGYYNFDNTSGAILQDFSGNGNDGIWSGSGGSYTSPQWTSSSAFNTWLDTDDYSWSTASNWSSGVPVSTDNVGIFDYSGGTSPSLSGTPTLNNLVVGSTSDLTLGSNATVNGNLFLYDDLDLNGQTITLGSTATVYEDNGLISGSTGTITTTRDLSGITAENVAGLGATITTAANMGSTTIIRGHSTTGIIGLNRYYQINPTTNTGLSATLVFNYDDSELNGKTESNLVLFKSTDDGVTWTEQAGGSLSTTNNTITLSSIGSFSWWTAAETGAALPIELLNFSANCSTEKLVELNWATATETNNSHFEIQKSIDTENFQTIGRIEGAANSNTLLNYNFKVENDENIISYYRLKQIDFDGKFEYSNVVAVDCSVKSNNTIDIYPNPFTNNININFNSITSGKISIEIRNTLGMIVYKDKLSDRISTYSIDLSNNNIPKGIYFVIISNDKETIVRKLLKE